MKINAGIMGLVIGDVMGTPIKGKNREELLDNPVTSIIKMDNLPLGVFSARTSLTLATMDSIAKKNNIDTNDIAFNFIKFLKNKDYTNDGLVLDIDDDTKKSIDNFYDEKNAEEKADGIFDSKNGCLARMLPVALYCHYRKLRNREVFDAVKRCCCITHCNHLCVLGCYIYVNYLLFILNGKDKFASYNMLKYVDYSYFDEDIVAYYNRLLKTNIAKLRVEDLKSTDYIVYTLESFFWVILNCSSFSESIVGAINLGEDTNTIGSLVGSAAGIIYGYETIPKKWIISLNEVEYIEDVIDDFKKTLLI